MTIGDAAKAAAVGLDAAQKQGFATFPELRDGVRVLYQVVCKRYGVTSGDWGCRLVLKMMDAPEEPLYRALLEVLRENE